MLVLIDDFVSVFFVSVFVFKKVNCILSYIL